MLGAVGALAWAGIPVGGLLAGWLAGGWGLGAALALCGAVYLVATLAPFVFPSWKQMDRARAPEPVLIAGYGTALDLPWRRGPDCDQSIGIDHGCSPHEHGGRR